MTYEGLFGYDLLVRLSSDNLDSSLRIYLPSKCLVGILNIHVSLLFHFRLDGIQLSILGFMCSGCLQFFRSICSTFSLFYLWLLLLLPINCVAKGTKIKLLLLLYDPEDDIQAYPYLYPKQLLNYHCFPKPIHMHHALTHILLHDALPISQQHYDELQYHAQEFVYLLILYIIIHKQMQKMTLYDYVPLLFLQVFQSLHHRFVFFHYTIRQRVEILVDDMPKNIHNFIQVEHITMKFVQLNTDKPSQLDQLLALPWNSNPIDSNRNHPQYQEHPKSSQLVDQKPVDNLLQPNILASSSQSNQQWQFQVMTNLMMIQSILCRDTYHIDQYCLFLEILLVCYYSQTMGLDPQQIDHCLLI